MGTAPSVEQIARRLAEFWGFHKTAEFPEYLKHTFGVAPLEVPQFDCIYIAQAREGDPLQGWISGLIHQWWVVDDEGLRPIVNPDLPLLLNEPENLKSGFYPKPVLKFYCSAGRITTGESFGPPYICRKVAKLEVGEDGLVRFVETRLLWTSASLGQK
jgi:hypothetical protein